MRHFADSTAQVVEQAELRYKAFLDGIPKSKAVVCKGIPKSKRKMVGFYLRLATVRQSPPQPVPESEVIFLRSDSE